MKQLWGGGDFNATTNELDRKMENKKRTQFSPDKNYQDFLNRNNLLDVHRQLHKKEVMYTFERGNSQSRIDHWLTDNINFTVFETKIHERNTILSDCHSLIELNFKINMENLNSEENSRNEKKKMYDRDPGKLKKIFENFKFSDDVIINRECEDEESEINRVINKVIEELQGALEEVSVKEKSKKGFYDKEMNKLENAKSYELR